MKYDELAFVNQQLAGMLRLGIPLESALQQLCQEMRQGKWRGEFHQLEQDLSQGVPIEQALEDRKFPELYKQMVRIGVKSNDLPALLILMADYYQKNHVVWTRLKGLMVYPLIVLAVCLALSIFLANVTDALAANVFTALGSPGEGIYIRSNQYLAGPLPNPARDASFFQAGVLAPVWILGSLAAAVFLLLVVPTWRRNARLLLPGFKEALLARLAASLGLLLKGGCDLGASFGLLRRLEGSTRLAKELARWQEELAQGRATFAQLRGKSRRRGPVPPLFFWLVASEGEDLPSGFARAAEIYYARALYKTEILLNAALPVSIMVLGGVIVVQLFSAVQLIFGSFLDQGGPFFF